MSDVFGPNRWTRPDASVGLNAWLTEIAARTASLNTTSNVFGMRSSDVVSNLLDDRRIPTSLLEAISDLTPSHWDAYFRANPEPQSGAAFPNRGQDPYHLTAIDSLWAMFGMSSSTFSVGMPGQGYTGAEGIGISRSNNPYLARETVIHDTTSAIMGVLQHAVENDPNFASQHRQAVTDHDLNEIKYGTASVELSAIVLGFEAFARSVADGILPPEASILSLFGPGVTTEQILELATAPRSFHQAVSNLGGAAGHIASTLAYYYGNSDLASTVVTQAFAKTLGGYVGDTISFEIVGGSLQAKVIYSRFFQEFVNTAAGVASGALANALNETFDITHPLGQFITTSLSSAVTNVFIEYAADEFGLSTAFARNYFDLSPANLVFSRTVLNGEIMSVFEGQIGGFLTGQIFSYLDQQWDAFNLSNIGASIGGIIGNFIAPGIGGFVGQVAGGILFDIFDGEPRSFHTVSYDAAQEEFVTTFSYARDDGDIGLSRQLAETAMGAVQFATVLIGGEIQAAQAFEYGHYENDLVYAGSSGRVSFDDANEMLDRGVLAQLRSLQIEGGNAYAKNLLSRSGYNPTLENFFVHLGVADVYNLHKLDPYLFGTQMINISDAGARRFVLTDWQETLREAHALGFESLAFNDGSEFIVRVSGSQRLSGGRGDDLLYAEDGTGALDGGDGDDIIRFDAAILTNGAINDVFGGAGHDTYIGDYSAFRRAEGDTSREGMEFTGSALWLGNSYAGRFYSIEKSNITGTIYDDYMVFGEFSGNYDGGYGIDIIDVSLDGAEFDVVFAIGNSAEQLLYGTASIRNFERVGRIATGAGNDTIIVGSPLLLDGRINDILAGTGFDTYIGDFSDFTREAGDASIEGIEFTGTGLWLGNIYAARFYGFEAFSLTGTRYDDVFDFTTASVAYDGGDGVDTVDIDLASVTSDITINFSNPDQQLIHGTASIRNFERVGRIATGAGNDTIIVGSPLLLDGRINDILAGTGFDTYIGDFSDFTREAGDASIEGIEFTGTGLWLGNIYAARFYGFEAFSLTGTRYDDLLVAGNANDLLDGGLGNDVLNGGAGNDFLIGREGSDTLNGGNGYDIAVYSGARGGYATATYSGVTGGVEGGTDTITGVEALAFVDGQLTFHRDGIAAQVMRLYDSAFNRIPDAGGFEAQLDAMEGGMSLNTLAQLFVESVEFQNIYGALSDQQFVEQLYRNVLDREGDSGGIANAVGSLATQGGAMTRGQLLVAFSESVEHMNLTQGTLDQGLWIADDQTLIIARLYDAAWNRLPDEGGLITWRNALGGGTSLQAIADAFAGAAEFTNTYGTLTDRQFVEQLYRNVLDREGDEGGIQNALNAIAGGQSRGQIMLAFSESVEHISLTRSLWIGGVSLYGAAAAPVEVKGADEPLTLPGADEFMPLDAGNDDGALVLPGVDDGLVWAKEADAALVLPGLNDGATFVTPHLVQPLDILPDDAFHGLRNEGWLG